MSSKKLALNSEQKSDFIILDTACFKLEETLVVWEKSKTMRNYGEAITHLKKAKTWMMKGLQAILDRIDEGEAGALNRRKATSEIVLMPKVSLEWREKQQPQDKYWLTKEQAYTLSEGIIEGFCRGCTREACTCEIRDHFHKWEIPGVVGQYDNCEYREG